MFRTILNAAALASAILMASEPANAAVVIVTGTRSNINTLNPPGTGRCAPMNTVNISPAALSSIGTSNLGNFTSTQSHCIAAAPSAVTPFQPLTLGQFVYDFGSGNTLTGIYSGEAIFASGLSTAIENLIVQGGTGLFIGATGVINTLGTLGFMPNPGGPGMVGVFDGTLTGRLDIPGVPEPASWAMMIAGFGLTGVAMRRRRSAMPVTIA